MDLNKIIYTPSFIFAIYLAIINIYGLSIMGIDKWKASLKGRRIPERVLFTIAFIGGSAGVYLGMRLFHHKTLHNKFKYGIPVILIVNIVAMYYVFSKL